jgi:hypothetical protein
MPTRGSQVPDNDCNTENSQNGRNRSDSNERPSRGERGSNMSGKYRRRAAAGAF